MQPLSRIQYAQVFFRLFEVLADEGDSALKSSEDLRRREAAHRNPVRVRPDRARWRGQRSIPFLDRRAALAPLLCHTEAGILLNEHVAEDGTVLANACRLAPRHRLEAVGGTYRSGPVLRLGQGPQPRKQRGTARAQRELEQANPELERIAFSPNVRIVTHQQHSNRRPLFGPRNA
jgi:hypothetical protein